MTRLDLDTEEDSLNNYAGIDRRNKAIAMVEQWAARNAPAAQFVYTIPTNTTGPDQGGSYVLQNAVVNHAQIAIVNVMTFDYYDNLPHEMGDETEGAATQIYDRLHELYPGKTSAQLWGMIGVTEDLGVDDFGPAETFTLADAHDRRAVGSGEGPGRGVLLEPAGRQHGGQPRQAEPVRVQPHPRAVHQLGCRSPRPGWHPAAASRAARQPALGLLPHRHVLHGGRPVRQQRPALERHLLVGASLHRPGR